MSAKVINDRSWWSLLKFWIDGPISLFVLIVGVSAGVRHLPSRYDHAQLPLSTAQVEALTAVLLIMMGIAGWACVHELLYGGRKAQSR